MRMMLRAIIALACLTALSACAPEVGSERWCKQMEGKPKSDWTANDATAFAKHCVLGIKTED